MNEIERPICGHCGHPVNGWGVADDTPLCHTGTVPPANEPVDCYRLVVAYSHKVDGSCCRSDGGNPPGPSATMAEVAEWYDAHDTSELDLEEAELEPSTSRTASRQLRLKRKDMESVTRIAKARRLGTAALMCEWVLERLAFEAGSDEEYSSTVETDPINPSDLAMVAAVTGGGIRAVEVRARFEDEE